MLSGIALPLQFPYNATYASSPGWKHDEVETAACGDTLHSCVLKNTAP